MNRLGKVCSISGVTLMGIVLNLVLTLVVVAYVGDHVRHHFYHGCGCKPVRPVLAQPPTQLENSVVVEGFEKEPEDGFSIETGVR